jgi:hypothetical protein
MRSSWASIAILAGVLFLAAFTVGEPDAPPFAASGEAPERAAGPPLPAEDAAPDPAIAGHQ